MSDDFEISVDPKSLRGVSVPDDLRNELWKRVESIIEDYQGKRPKTVDKTTDSVAAFFGGPSMGQSSWARECVVILGSLTGQNIAQENESDLQALRRLFVTDEPRWMVGILEFLLQGWGRDGEDQFNQILSQRGSPVRFTNGTLDPASDEIG